MSENNGMATMAVATIDTEQVNQIVSTVTAVLANNKLSVDKAKSTGKALLDTIEAEGMNDGLDEQANGFLVKIRKTLEKMNDTRKPITQILDLIKKEFTQLESELDPKTRGGIFSLIQGKRDEYATWKAGEQRRKEQEAQRKLAMDKELINLKSECQMQLASYFNSHLSDRISAVNRMFNDITLEHFSSVAHAIKTFPDEYGYEHFNSFSPSLRPLYATKEQVDLIISETRKGKLGGFSNEFNKQLAQAKRDILDRLPSRKTELEHIEREKKINAEKAKLMEEQAKERQQIENAKREKEAEERQVKAESTINTEAQASMTETLFERQQILSEAPQQSAQVRESYEIEVLNPLGGLLIAQFYFEHEGKTSSWEKLEKKTLGSMKKFCESFALKNEEKISSPFLKYNEKFKTVAKKA